MLNPLDLSGKKVLVTGASSGIGRDTAVLLSELGGQLVLIARSQPRLEETAALLKGDGHTVAAYDLSDYENIPDWMKLLALRHGPFDGLVHSAGVHMIAPLRMLNAAKIEELWKVNVTAGLWLAKGFRQKGVNAQGGSLVFLSSVAGLVGQPAVAAYSASKGAVNAMVKSLALELARENIRVNSIAPGMIMTEMTERFTQQLTADQLKQVMNEHPLGFGRTSDVAYAVAYLLSGATRWVTGTVLVVDGGYTAH